MKIRSPWLAIFIVLTSAFSVVPANAQTVTPCEVFICMAGISGSGQSGGPACIPTNEFWSAPAPDGLAVYVDGVFIPPASAEARRSFISTCDGVNYEANPAIQNAIIAQHGYTP